MSKTKTYQIDVSCKNCNRKSKVEIPKGKLFFQDTHDPDFQSSYGRFSKYYDDFTSKKTVGSLWWKRQVKVTENLPVYVPCPKCGTARLWMWK